MNRENARQYIPHLEALADGELELNLGTLNNPIWENRNSVHFDCPAEYYRRRPKPREVWVVVSQSGVISTVVQREEDARHFVTTRTGYTYFRAVEVIQ